MTKTCAECLYYDAPFCDYHAMKVASTRKSCDLFEPKEKPPTNGDKIRQMSDDELAELLADNTCTDCGFFGMGQDGVEICTMTVKDTCKDGKLAWLKQEAKDE